ncbi:MAG: SDR family NAD(P)-dependent oxidoreductase [Betaproteobacteria bacterium]|nr:SDR family NAD(P)-dependent oxidoreductase [Betaproteobacteria bacterium]MDE2623484.1 SDR family NAD(P)-dependent oxidoreductase [Betaproteobacteria bacterium]
MPFFAPLNPPVAAWPGQRVWIVGASSGIGAETARLLARRGARLALSGRRAETLDALASELATATGSEVRSLPCDITDAQAVAAGARTLCEAWGDIDLVLVAAGIYDALRPQEFHEGDLPAVRHTLDTNLLGAYHVLAAVLPGFRHRGRGHLAFVSSVAGYNGLPQALAYAPSKAALNNLCEGLYLELQPLGIAVTRICPGFVDTPLIAGGHFPTPALQTPQAAARAIVLGLERGDFEIHFPRYFTSLLKVLQWLPRRLYFFLLRQVTRP